MMDGLFEYKGERTSDWVAVVVHGSTQVHYDDRHPLVRLLKKHVSTVYSLDLPGHGSMSKQLPKNVSEATNIFFEMIRPVVENKRLLIVGFSMGGIFTIKKWRQLKEVTEQLVGIMIGVGLFISDTQLAQIRLFFSERHYRISGWVKRMEEMHGSHWKELVYTIGSWFDPNFPDNALFRDEEREMIVDEPLFFVIGNRDQAFSLDGFSIFPERSCMDLVNYTSLFIGPPESRPDPLSECDLERHVFIIAGHHFSYFHPKAAFPIVGYIIENLLRCLGVSSNR